MILWLYFLLNVKVIHNFEVFERKDCDSIVSTGYVSYKGCKYSIPTDSLSQNTTLETKDIYIFKGVPYAQPPTGALRFRRTQPLIYTRPTVIDCSQYGSPCTQPFRSSGRSSEDCLYLNIWTPTLDPSARLAVMFFIHGGGFHMGSGHQYVVDTLSVSNAYGGGILALRDVVVVTINYRLGVWGFLYGNSSDCPGNMGYWDQTTALNWTRHHIQEFGGDPNQMTVFGESAGSISISNHMVSNVTRNWFRRVIMQSGSAYNKMWSRDRDYSYAIARRFASDVKLWQNSPCAEDHTWIECLRDKSAEELLSAQEMSTFWEPRDPWNIVGLSSHFRPIFGDEFITKSVNRAVKEGDFRKDIKIIIGHNEMEGAIVTSMLDVLAGLLGRYVSFIPRPPLITKAIVFNDIQNVLIENKTIAQKIAKKFTEPFNRISVHLNPSAIRKTTVHMFGDYSLTCPTVLFGAYASRAPGFRGKVYQYRLTYGSTQSLSKYSTWAQVSHTDELPLVFGVPFKPLERVLWDWRDRKMSKHFMDIWTHFAKYDEILKINGNVWPEYGVNANNNAVNAKYIEFHANDDRMGTVYENCYEGRAERITQRLINNCFNFWDQIISEQF